MNIFIFDNNFHESAKWFFNNDFKRANKQILESTEMIAVACDKFGFQKPFTKTGTPYKATRHINHPSTKWTYSNLDNFENHLSYVLHLCDVFSSLQNKDHACKIGLLKAGLNIQQLNATADFLFVGHKDYTMNINDNDNIYQKYTTYIQNKWQLQDNSGD